MSVFSWPRRPSAPEPTGAEPRPRTTSGGGLVALAGSMLSKAKSKERLRSTKSSNRQTVVSTESESSVWPNEPTTPSSGSDKRSFQGIVGMVGDDPFARPPVLVKESVPSLAAFPVPPRPRQDPIVHLHPPSPKSSSSKLSPRSSRTSSPNRSRSTSSSSTHPPPKSPRTPPLVTSVSSADMHAHADAFAWTDSIYDDRRFDEHEPSIRRGQSAHAVLSPSRPPRLAHSASSSHLSSSASVRAGTSDGYGSMTALASGIVQRLEDGETRKKPPKRPSRSELRDPPTRKSSLLALQGSSTHNLPTPESRPIADSPRTRTLSSPPRTLASPRLLPSSPSPRTLSSPRLLPSSPRPTRLSEDSEDLDNYHFAIAPTIQETDAQSISFSELGLQLADDEDVWSDDGVTFHHGPTDSLHYVSADSGRYGPSARRPPPSPTSLPFMAGNVRHRPKRDMVYPSGVHTIPVADRRALAEVGKEEDAVVGKSITPIQEPCSPAESRTSFCSLIAPDAVPPQTISSHIAFSKHARTASYSDSEIDFEISRKPWPVPSTQTAVAWRCGAGNTEKCCQTRATQETRPGRFKCCAERTTNGKHARCCASYIGRPCERPRVSSTSSVELKRQRSLHFASAKGFFHRPHTSHGKSTSSALLDEETKALIHSQTREDPGPQSPPLETSSSPPTSPASRHEFRAKPIISPAKLQDHLKDMRWASSSAEPPLRARSNTDTSGSISSRSVFSNLSEDPPAPMRSLLPPRPRRNQNVSLPVMKSGQLAEQPRRYVQSITGAVQSAGFTRPMPPPPPPLSSPGPSLSSIMSGAGTAHFPLRSGLPPPRRDHIGRTNTKPIVSFISSRSAPTPTRTPFEPAATTTLRHCSSRESYESSRTVRRERSIPLREAQISFLEFGVDEEEEEEEEEEQDDTAHSAFRPLLHRSQSFLDLDLSRISGDTMLETDAMFSR